MMLWHHYDVLSANRVYERAGMLLCNDKTRTNSRVIMSHIIKDDGLIAQHLLCALSLSLSLSISLGHYELSSFASLLLAPPAKNPIIWCQKVQTISEVSLLTEIRQQVISLWYTKPISLTSLSLSHLHSCSSSYPCPRSVSHRVHTPCAWQGANGICNEQLQ